MKKKESKKAVDRRPPVSDPNEAELKEMLNFSKPPTYDIYDNSPQTQLAKALESLGVK